MKKALVCLALLSVCSLPALAHTGHPAAAAGTSFMAGFMHLLTGLDHVAAWVLLGMVASAHAKPIKGFGVALGAFMVAVGVGAAAPAWAPVAEWLIVASLVVLAAVVLVKVPARLGLLSVVAVVMAGHGMAHGAVLPANGWLAFALGAGCAAACISGLAALLWGYLLKLPALAATANRT